MELTVRKNFVFDADIAKHLEDLAKDAKQSMTSLVQELIEERHKKSLVKRRILALQRLSGCATGLLSDFSIQKAKAEMNV